MNGFPDGGEMSFAIQQALFSFQDDVYASSVGDLDTSLSVPLFATLTALSLTAGIFLISSLEKLETLSHRDFGEKYKTEREYQNDLESLRAGGRSLFRAFFLFLAALVIAAFVVDGALESTIASDPNLQIGDVIATGAPFAAGLYALFDGSKRIFRYYQARLADRSPHGPTLE